jgi:hypothetical protein
MEPMLHTGPPSRDRATWNDRGFLRWIEAGRASERATKAASRGYHTLAREEHNRAADLCRAAAECFAHAAE